jgi:hypothetical protein
MLAQCLRVLVYLHSSSVYSRNCRMEAANAMAVSTWNRLIP